MENQLEVFSNELFEVAIKLENGEWVFDAESVAKSLGFTEVKNDKDYVMWRRVNQYLKPFGITAEKFEDIKKGDFIPESAVYKLAFKANNEIAEKFQDWLAIDVLPQIRKTGQYNVKKELLQIESLETVNKTMEIILPILKDIGLDPKIIALSTKVTYRKAGLELPFEIKTEEKFYDTVQIAKELGVFTRNNNPASTAVSQIIKKIDVLPDEKIDTFEGKGNWQGTVTKYTFPVIERLMNWFNDNDYPTIIQGEKKNYNVIYKAMGAIKGV